MDLSQDQRIGSGERQKKRTKVNHRDYAALSLSSSLSSSPPLSPSPSPSPVLSVMSTQSSLSPASSVVPDTPEQQTHSSFVASLSPPPLPSPPSSSVLNSSSIVPSTPPLPSLSAASPQPLAPSSSSSSSASVVASAVPPHTMTLACAVYRTLRVKTKHHAVDNQSRARHQHRPRTAACEGGTSASGDREGNGDAYGYVWNIFWSLLRSDPCWCARKKTGERTEGVRVKDMCDMSGGRNNKHGSDMSGPRANDRGRINSNMCMSYGMSTSSSITGERMLHRCNNGDAVAAAGGQGGGHSGGDVSNRGGGGDCEGRREATSVKNTLLALHKLAAHFNLFSRLPSLLIYMQGIDVCVDVDRHKAGDGQCSLLLNPRNSDHVHHHPRDDNHTRAHMQSHKHSHNHSHTHIYPHNHHRARTQKAVAATYMKGADEGGNQTRDNQHQHNNNASLQSRFCRLSPFHQCSLLLFIMHHQHHISTPEFRKFLRLYVRDCRDLQRVNGGEGERGGNTMSNEHGGNPSNTILPSASLYSPPHTHQYCTSTCMLARSLLGLLVIDAVDAKTKKACIHMNKRKNQNKNKNNTSNSGGTGRVDGPQNKSRSDGGDGPFDYEFGGAVGMSMGILEGMLGLSAGALSLDSGIDVGGHGRAGRAFGGKNDDENENENENDDENDGGGGGNGSGDSDGHGHGMCSDGVDSDRRGNFGGRNGADNIADNHADRDYAAQSESESDGAGCSSPGELGQNDLSRDTELACFDIRMFRADSVDRYVETDTSNGGTDRHLAASLSSPPSSAAAAPTKRVIQALLKAKLGHITDLRQEGSQPHHRQPRRYHSSLSDYAYCHPYHRQPSQHLPRSRQKQLHEQCFMHECRSIFNQSLFKAHTARAVLPCPPAAPASPSSTSASSSPSTSTSSSTSTSASVSYAGSDESTHTRKKQRLAASASVPSQDAEMDTTGDVVGDGGDAHNTAKGKSEDGSNTRKAMTRRHGGAANDEEARDSADCSAERSTFKSKDSTDTGVADAGPPLLEPRAARNEGAGVGAGAGHRNSNAHSVYPSDDSDEASSRGQREDGKNHEQQQQGGGEEVEEEDKEDKEDEALNDDVIALISLLSALSPASFNVLSSASSAPQLMQAHAPASQVGQILQHLREINESSDERYMAILQRLRHHTQRASSSSPSPSLSPSPAVPALPSSLHRPLSDNAISVLSQRVLTDDSSYARCVAYFSTMLVPIISSLKRPASRILFTVIVKAAKSHPKPIIYGLLVPLLTRAPIGTSQSEVINRVAKECLSDSLRISLLSEILTYTIQSAAAAPAAASVVSVSPSAPPALVWTDLVIGVIQNLMNLRLKLAKERQVCHDLVACFQTVLLPLNPSQARGGVKVNVAKSLKFSTLVFTFLSRYKLLAKDYKHELTDIVNSMQTFMKKAASTALKRL